MICANLVSCYQQILGGCTFVDELSVEQLDRQYAKRQKHHARHKHESL